MQNSVVDAIDQTIEHLVSNETAASIGSIEPAANARAIAVSDLAVQGLIKRNTRAGLMLRQVRCDTPFGGDIKKCKVVFTFEARSPHDGETMACVATVNVTTKSVVRIEETSDAENTPCVPVPLAFAIPSRSKQACFTEAQLMEKRQREEKFRKYIGGDVPATFASNTYNSTVEDTYYGTPGTDTDGHPVTVVDHGNDLSGDPTNDDPI